MRHGVRWIFGLLLLAAVLTLSACAGAPDVPEVLDSDDLLTPGERSVLESEVRAAADAAGCAFSVVFYRSAGGSDSYLGEDYLEDYGLSDSADLVLLVVTLEDSGRDLPGDGYYYDLYLYGSASRRILQGEANAILDAGAVYGPLKSGRLAEGTGAFLELAAAEYGNGDYERSPYLRALPVAAVIALAFMPEDMNSIIALYPVFLATSMQWCLVKGPYGYAISSVFSTNNLRQFITGIVRKMQGKDDGKVSRVHAFGLTLLSFHAGAAAAYIAVMLMQMEGIWIALVPIAVAFALSFRVLRCKE